MPNYSCGHQPWMNQACIECRPDLFSKPRAYTPTADPGLLDAALRAIAELMLRVQALEDRFAREDAAAREVCRPASDLTHLLAQDLPSGHTHSLRRYWRIIAYESMLDRLRREELERTPFSVKKEP